MIWAIAHRIPPVMAKTLTWGVRLLLVAALLYAALWLVLLVVALMVLGSAIRHADLRWHEEDESEVTLTSTYR